MSQQTVKWMPHTKPFEEWEPLVKIFFFTPLDDERLMQRMQDMLNNLSDEWETAITVNVVQRRALLRRKIHDLEECIAYVPRERFRIAQERIRILLERRLRAVDQRLAFSMLDNPRLGALSPFRDMPRDVMQKISQHHWNAYGPTVGPYSQQR